MIMLKLFLDYDRCLLQDVLADLKRLGIKEAEIYLSRRVPIVGGLYLCNYHVIANGIRDTGDIERLTMLSGADVNFKRCTQLYPFQVLRIGPKRGFRPRLIATLRLRTEGSRR